MATTDKTRRTDILLKDPVRTIKAGNREDNVAIAEFENIEPESFKVALQGYIDTLPYVRGDINIAGRDKRTEKQLPIIGSVIGFNAEEGTITVRWKYTETLPTHRAQITGLGRTINGKIQYTFISNIEMIK